MLNSRRLYHGIFARVLVRIRLKHVDEFRILSEPNKSQTSHPRPFLLANCSVPDHSVPTAGLQLKIATLTRYLSNFRVETCNLVTGYTKVLVLIILRLDPSLFLFIFIVLVICAAFAAVGGILWFCLPPILDSRSLAEWPPFFCILPLDGSDWMIFNQLLLLALIAPALMIVSLWGSPFTLVSFYDGEPFKKSLCNISVCGGCVPQNAPQAVDPWAQWRSGPLHGVSAIVALTSLSQGAGEDHDPAVIRGSLNHCRSIDQRRPLLFVGYLRRQYTARIYVPITPWLPRHSSFWDEPAVLRSIQPGI
ncbi:hypothetical protein DFH08DRAFT_819082 [Mycena albidolilacea]|uniref:Uncharacterized protein n=1 Tax=Mycena albidolilacea TaxID=1033008 RepID=A0AAD6ZGG5_9AGAR|nr:hypothetical protein DFH08DRAFT_819082 [Mycena albidolilacea]